MPFVDAAKNAMLDHLGTLSGFLSAHTAWPGATGTNEVTGGSPAYARKAITWNAAATGNKDSSNQPQFDVPASTEVQFYGLWSASTAGTYYGSMPIGGQSPLAFYTNETTNKIIAHAHGLSNDQKVVFIGGTPPGGLTEGTVYFIVNAGTDDFEVAATQGGAAIDLTTERGTGCRVTRIIPETFGSQGTLTATDVDLSIGGF